MSCPQCQATNEPGSASCGRCGATLAVRPWYLTDPLPSQAGLPAETYVPSTSASQFPRTPGEQFLPDSRAGRYIPGADLPVSHFRPSWRRLTLVEQTAGGATLIVLGSLFLPWFGLGSVSDSGTGTHGYLVLVILLAVLMAGYLLQRSGRPEFPFSLPVRHETVLITAAGAQFLLVAVGFADMPIPGLHREFGAYLALIAAAAAVGAALIPAWPAAVIRKSGAP